MRRVKLVTRSKASLSLRVCAVLVLQNDTGNQYSSITIVVPFLNPKGYPFVVNIKPTKNNGQLRVAHFSRFGNKIGNIESSYWAEIEEAIAIELAIFGR